MSLRRTLALFNPTVFVALLILGAFLYGTWWMNESGRRSIQFKELRQRVIRHVDQHPEKVQVTLDDLQKAGVLTAEDLEFLRKEGITYYPVGAKSGKDTICFVQRRGTEETRYAKDDTAAYLRRWLSPDEKFELMSAPKPDVKDHRTVSVVETATGKVVGIRDLEASSIQEAFWRDDSRCVALTVHRPLGGGEGHRIECQLLEIGPAGVRPIAAPDDLRPDRLLPPEHAGNVDQWFSHSVMPKSWRGDTLTVESQGNGRIGPVGGKDSLSFNLIYRFDLRVQNGTATVVQKTKKHLAVVPMK